MITARLAVLLDCAVKEQGGVYTCTPPRTAQQIADALVTATAAENAANTAATTQDQDVAALLAGAQTLINNLRAEDVEYVAARAQLATALNGTNLPVGASLAALRTAILATGTYLQADHEVGRLLGADVIAVVKALGNRIARDAGSTTVLT
jgi:hypothetical protein